MRSIRCVLVTLLALPAPDAFAQDLSLLFGRLTAESAEESYSWQGEYRHRLGEHAAVSFSWLNEGHIEDHHRDGPTVQFWGRTALGPVTLMAGIGPYLWFDTARAAAGASYDNDHGWGALGTVAASWRFAGPWLLDLRVNHVLAEGGFETTAVLAGVGYQLDYRETGEPPASARSGTGAATRNELTLLVGQTVVNSFNNESNAAVSLEYRRRVTPHLEASIAWLDEGDTRLIRRNGIVAQGWLVGDYLDQRLSLGAGLGPYIAIDKQHSPELGDTDTVSAMISVSAAYRFAEHWLGRVTWHRVATGYSRDTDVFLLGLGYHF